jgi:serine/threonine protein kinase
LLSRFPRALGWSLLLTLLGSAVAVADEAGELSWVNQERLVGFGDWRQRLVRHGNELWLGGWSAADGGRGRLLRWAGGLWQRLEPPGPGDRTFVLASDGEGGLWVAPYAPDLAELRRELAVYRFDGARWERSVVRPGLWPQAMALRSRRSGWIGGNGGRFARFEDGRWSLEQLAPEPGSKRPPDVLALALSGREEGWAVGTLGLVARLVEGRWQRQRVPPELAAERLFAVALDADGQPWVAGSNGLLARFDGHAWQRLETGIREDLLGLSVTGAGEVWAVGARGVLVQRRGDGRITTSVLGTKTLYDAVATGSRAGWVVGQEGLFRAQARSRFSFREEPRLGRLASDGADAEAAVALDLDGVGGLDLALLQAGRVRVHLQAGPRRGGEVFGERLDPLAAPFAGSALAMAWADGDGDGQLDLAVLGGEPEGVWWVRQRAPGRFAPPQLLAEVVLGEPNGGCSLGWLDLDGEGRLDLVLQRSPRADGSVLAPLLLRAEAPGLFAAPRELPVPHLPEGFALWAELDGEPGVELVLPGVGGRVALLGRDRDPVELGALGRGADPAEPWRSGGFLDADGDGALDLLLLSRRLALFANDGRGRFRPAALALPAGAHNPAMPATPLAVGDLDLDGRSDALLSTWLAGRHRTHLLTAEGGSWQDEAEAAGLADLAPRSLVLGDWDGDGDLDLFVSEAERATLLVNQADVRRALEVRPLGPSGRGSSPGTEVRAWSASGAALGRARLGEAFHPASVPAADRVVLGLPPATRVELEVRFPSGRVVRDSAEVGRGPVVVHELPLAERALWRLERRLSSLRERARAGAEAGLAALLVALLLGLQGRQPWTTVVLVAAHGVGAWLLADRVEPAWYGVRGAALVGLAVVASALARALAAHRRRRWIGPYRLGERLGEGGMGVVYRACHRDSGCAVALKVVQPHRPADPASRRRFLREAGALASLRHPGIVRVHEAGEHEGRAFLALELLEGETLAAHLERTGPLEVEAVRQLLTAAAEALAEVHRHGILHRDLSSRNLFLVDSAEPAWGPRLRLTDFGLARPLTPTTQTDLHALVGTVAYLAPELLCGEEADVRSDLYALGVVAYELLAGRRPFAAENALAILAQIQAGGFVPLGELRRDLPAAFEALVAELLARERAARPASAGLLARRLGSLDSAPAASPPPTHEVPAWRPLFERATASWEARRPVEAQAILSTSLAELRAGLAALAPEERASYWHRHRVEDVLELARRLEVGA